MSLKQKQHPAKEEEGIACGPETKATPPCKNIVHIIHIHCASGDFEPTKPLRETLNYVKGAL